MRVNIMSMQRVINYGSYLQAFGLKQLIMRCRCEKVSFVDIEGESIPKKITVPRLTLLKEKYHKLRYLSIFGTNNEHFEPYKKYQNLLVGQHVTNNMISKSWPRLGLPDSLDYGENCDVLVIGSDEMFNCTMPNYRERPLALFGSNKQYDKKISYAVSCGDTTLDKIYEYNMDKSVKEAINSFDALSVRDKGTYDLVKNLTGREPLFHLDPVLIYEFPEIENIRVKHKGYIAVYGYGNNINDPDIISELKAFAKKRGLKLLAIGNGQDFCDDIVAFSPFEVLAYIKYADYVFTNTFHGTVFALKYGIPFTLQLRGMNQNKLGDLVERFNVLDRVITDSNIPELELIMEKPLDTEFIEKMIAENRIKTRDYLSINLLGDNHA